MRAAVGVLLAWASATSSSSAEAGAGSSRAVRHGLRFTTRVVLAPADDAVRIDLLVEVQNRRAAAVRLPCHLFSYHVARGAFAGGRFDFSGAGLTGGGYPLPCDAAEEALPPRGKRAYTLSFPQHLVGRGAAVLVETWISLSDRGGPRPIARIAVGVPEVGRPVIVHRRLEARR